jgi:hypothetical protein
VSGFNLLCALVLDVDFRLRLKVVILCCSSVSAGTDSVACARGFIPVCRDCWKVHASFVLSCFGGFLGLAQQVVDVMFVR